jgi:hypothetical protein
MPPTGERLTPEQITRLRLWIDQGARWPQTASHASSPKDHWAFQPVSRPALPAVVTTSWVRNGVDAFVLARLEQAGLEPSPEGDRATLLRRLKLDLLGLPPTPEEVEAFVADRDERAYEKLVERYLASPHYGERWARHWLDVVRFAESDGFETNQPRLNAWPYRDYVIRCLNEDRPYDRFITEQLAGDALGEDAATGFLVGGTCDKVKSPEVALTAQQRADELHDMLSTTASTFLGLTAGCARCHNHKFDPISQLDYYGLKAVFAGVEHGERALVKPQAGIDQVAGKRPAVNRKLNVEKFAPVEAKYVRLTIHATSDNEPCIDELEVFTAGPNPRNVALASNGTRATASSTLPGYAIHKLEHINDGQYGNGRSWISNERGKGWVQLELPDKVLIERIVWSRDREEPGKYNDRLPTRYVFEVAVRPGDWHVVASSDDRLPYRTQGNRPPGQMVYGGKFTAPEVTYRLHRGDPLQKREVVAPAVLAEIGPRLELELDAPEQHRRLALARWITDPRHPLTARVLCNRVWHYHFGQGLVRTPSDFGHNGDRPSHPELLDWLAGALVDSDWRLKPLHRLIVLSSTYRQASSGSAKGLAADAGARLLWRYPPRRLEAEPVRDAILSVSGKLDLRMGGPGFDLFEPNSNYVKVYMPKKVFGPEEWRRMVYQSKPRMQLDDTFGPFDCPDAGQITPRRTSSTTALQALNLLNSRFLIQQADFFAERLRQEAGDEPAAQVKRAFWLAFQRPATEEELAAGMRLVQDHGLPALCRALFNANEFLYVF